MLAKSLVSVFCALAFSASTLAHPHPNAGPSSDELIAFLHRRIENSNSGESSAAEASSSTSASSSEATGSAGSAGAFSAARFPDVQAALAGNQRFRDTRDAAAIQALVDNGQKPPFMMAQINVASHIVNTWIGDIRTLYLTSDRTEIAEMRAKNLAIEAEGGTVEEPDIKEPGFRALVEENVKQQVQRIADSSVMKNRFDEIITKLNTDGTPKPATEERRAKRAEEGETLKPIFVHGWVHDLETGEVLDLNVSVGPAGFEDFVPPASNGEGEATPSATETASAPSETATETATESASNSSSSEESSTTASSSAAAEEGEGEGEATSTSSAATGEETVSTPQNAVVAPEAEVEPTVPVSANVNNDVRVHGPSQVNARRSNARALASSLLGRSVSRISRRGVAAESS
ncbi:hypothetical protein FRC18_002279 [Serendipita sp. 400]|nr:hypothetical protein FRC18_002279 [Serendipita sp. 400]